MAGVGERAIMPRVSSLLRSYSGPKTTTSTPQLYRARRRKGTAIPYRIF
jgi:hypothetical protein